jgi:hypothetical protein
LLTRLWAYLVFAAALLGYKPWWFVLPAAVMITCIHLYIRRQARHLERRYARVGDGRGNIFWKPEDPEATGGV